MRISTHLGIALAALTLLFGCQATEPSGAPTEQSSTLRYIDAEPLLALSKDDISRIVRVATHEAGQTGQMTPIADIELLAKSEFGQGWVQDRFHRALVVGTPARHCPYYGGSWGEADREAAIRTAFSRCQSYVGRVSKALGHKCRCRIAALDDALFMAPDELPYRDLLPTIVFTRQTRTEGAQTEVYLRGFLDLSGRIGAKQPFRLMAADGEERCTGHYDSKAPAHGEVFGRCVGFDSPLKGVYQVQGFYKGRSYGILAARTADRSFVALFGLAEEDFSSRGNTVYRYFEPRR